MIYNYFNTFLTQLVCSKYFRGIFWKQFQSEVPFNFPFLIYNMPFPASNRKMCL